MTRKVHRHLSAFSKKMLLILGLIVGCVAMLSTEFIFGSRSALLSARRRMESESRYIAEQCILYDEVGSEEETKSLIRVADKAQQLQRIFSDEDSGFDDAVLYAVGQCAGRLGRDSEGIRVGEGEPAQGVFRPFFLRRQLLL